MSVHATAIWQRHDWLVPSALIALSLVPSIAGGVRLAELSTGAVITPANARFFAAPLPIVLHILAVIPYGILGALQFAPRFRRRHPTWHRRAGKALLGCAPATALSGLWMTLFYPWPAGDGYALYVMRLVAGVAMLVSVLAGIAAIRRCDFRAHGEWMIRAYAIAMGAGTQVLTHLPWFIFVGKPAEAPRAFLMAAGWVINIIVAELVIARGDRRAVLLPTTLMEKHA
ncbi:MAG TPA: DUF2306 domain-containing protein [Gemmatimonadaceae bacterium]|jgi:uncharacterized membrane protein